MLHEPLASRLAIQLAPSMKMNLRQPASRRVRAFDAETAARVMQIEKDAATLAGNRLERAWNQFVAIASGAAENVAGQAVGVHANQRGRWPLEIPADERDVLVVVHVAGIRDHAEIAEARRENRLGDAANIALMLHPVANQVRDRKHLQAVLAAKLGELPHARHGAVFVHDFADLAGRIKPRDAREVHGSLRLSGADEHTPVFRAKGKHVSGPSEVLRL